MDEGTRLGYGIIGGLLYLLIWFLIATYILMPLFNISFMMAGFIWLAFSHGFVGWSLHYTIKNRS